MPRLIAPGRQGDTVTADMRAFIDRVVVPALLERFLREYGAERATPERPAA